MTQKSKFVTTDLIRKSKNILLHELQHIKGNDTSIKILYILIKSLFWWNPIVFSFQREVENLLELRCDARVIKSINEDERIMYLESILRIIKRIGLDSQDYSPSMSSLVNAKEDTFIKQRFEIVLNKSERFKKKTAIATVIVMIALFIGSYFIMLQPAYLPPEIEGETVINFTGLAK
ncbi:MAG: M56 family metallopeptidase [Anaerovoracaceae bacterium]